MVHYICRLGADHRLRVAAHWRVHPPHPLQGWDDDWYRSFYHVHDTLGGGGGGGGGRGGGGVHRGGRGVVPLAGALGRGAFDLLLLHGDAEDTKELGQTLLRMVPESERPCVPST